MTQPAAPFSPRITPLERVAIHDIPERPRRGSVIRYAIAVALTLAAFGLTMLLDAYLQQ